MIVEFLLICDKLPFRSYVKCTDTVRLVQLRELIQIIKGCRRRLFGRDGRLFVSRSSVRVGRQCDRLALRTICFVDSVADRIVAVGV